MVGRFTGRVRRASYVAHDGICNATNDISFLRTVVWDII